MVTAMSWELPLETSQTVRDYSFEVALKNGASSELADDIAQITVLRINEAAARNPAVIDFVQGRNWRAYVASATRNVLAGYHRSETKRLKREESEAWVQERLAEEARELDELLAVLLLEELSVHLTPEEQRFLHLRYFLGMRIREIATALGTTEARVSHVGRSAIRKLERALLDR